MYATVAQVDGDGVNGTYGPDASVITVMATGSMARKCSRRYRQE